MVYTIQKGFVKVLLSGKSHYSSYALIKAEVLDNIIMGDVFALAFIPVAFNRRKSMSVENIYAEENLVEEWI